MLQKMLLNVSFFKQVHWNPLEKLSGLGHYSNFVPVPKEYHMIKYVALLMFVA
jgi:hypothetical protein